MNDQESQSVEAIRAQNQRSISDAFTALIAQANQISSESSDFLLEINTKLIDNAGNQSEVKVRMDGNIVEENQVVLTFSIRDVQTNGLVLNFPGNFFKQEDETYLENKEGLTFIRLHDERFSGLGVPTAIVSQINDLRTAIFQRFASRLNINRFFVLAQDSSNKADLSKRGWTSRRMHELGYTQIDQFLFRKCVYLFRE